jgi:hypothetical protein
MKDNILTYRQKTSDRLIRCVAAKGTVRLVVIEGTNLVREARRVTGFPAWRLPQWGGN